MQLIRVLPLPLPHPLPTTMNAASGPQLQLNLSAANTSFKRSFSELGFDPDSPLDETGSSGSSVDGSERSKRSRSEGSDIDALLHTSASSSTSTPSSSSQTASTTTLCPGEMMSASHVGSSSASLEANEPEVLPSPMEGIEGSSQSSLENRIQTTSNPEDEQYRISMERFNAFDSNISLLRRSPSPVLDSQVGNQPAPNRSASDPAVVPGGRPNGDDLFRRTASPPPLSELFHSVPRFRSVSSQYNFEPWFDAMVDPWRADSPPLPLPRLLGARPAHVESSISRGPDGLSSTTRGRIAPHAISGYPLSTTSESAEGEDLIHQFRESRGTLSLSYNEGGFMPT